MDIHVCRCAAPEDVLKICRVRRVQQMHTYTVYRHTCKHLSPMRTNKHRLRKRTPRTRVKSLRNARQCAAWYLFSKQLLHISVWRQPVKGFVRKLWQPKRGITRKLLLHTAKQHGRATNVLITMCKLRIVCQCDILHIETNCRM